MPSSILIADYTNPEHIEAIGFLLKHYAKDPFGGGKDLDDDAGIKICEELNKRDYAFSLLAFVDNKPAGLTTCFESFSTFSCKPIVNIHDIVVHQHYRGRGLSHSMLSKVEEIAREKDCAKLTLEVLSNNNVAKASYQTFGFISYELDPQHGHALFWEKPLS